LNQMRPSSVRQSVCMGLGSLLRAYLGLSENTILQIGIVNIFSWHGEEP
jgi:hypothetical protein